MTVPTWYPDELTNAGSEHLDPDYVQTYDRKANTDPSSELSLLLELGLDQTQTLVDFGAGTGIFALSAAPYCRRVIAVDVSPAMIAALREKTEQLRVRNIDCVLAGFLSFEHAGDPVDFVYSRHALHHLPDFWKAIALQRISSILKPRGILRLSDLVYSFDSRNAGPAIEEWLAGAAKDARNGWTIQELEIHLRTEHSTFNWLLELMLERAGFEILDANHRSSGIYSAYTCVKRV